MTSKKNLPRAVVITPTYNERENVEQLVRMLRAVFARVKNYEMLQLVVDDTSPDKTYEVVQKLQKKEPQLKLLINAQKSGLGGAYLKGMDYAFKQLGAAVVFEFDADMQHDEKKIPDFLKKIDQGYDLVLGSRYIKGGSIPSSWGLQRKFLSVVGNWVIMLVLTDFRVHDWTSGFRALTKKVYQRIGPEMSHKEFQGYTFQVAFLHKAVRAGFQVAEVPFHFTERTAGESKLGTEYIKNNLYYLFKARYLEIVDSRVFKMICVGALGAAVQFLCHSLLCWLGVPNLGAVVVSTELAIISNFICNNAWTFKDRQLAKGMLARKFVEFNVGSLPSLLIQAGISWGGEKLWGLVALLTIGGVTIGTGTIYLMVGILIGMVVNFFIYSHVVWRKK